jgi:tripartite-type tricarboxylate transporter receptor subunit TctC
MEKKTKVCLVAIMMVGICFLMLNSTNLVIAKDQDYPTKSINFIIPFGAGGTTDVTSRALIKATNKYLAEPIIPINKPGGGGVTPALEVMNAKPDGYTIGAFSSTHSLMLPNTEECPYKDISGFSIILRYGKYLWPVVVRSDSSWKTWEELVAWAKKNPKGAIK